MSKILVVALMLMVLCIIAGIFVNKIKLNSMSALVFAICGLVIGFNGWAIAYDVIRLPSEQVEITANPDGSSDGAVFLKKYNVDDRDYDVTTPVEGKWIKQGDTFGWMPEEGIVVRDITNTITVEIPVGRDRKLYFNAGEGAGTVSVRYGDEVYTKDLSSVSGKKAVISIADSGSRQIYGHKVALLAGYVFLMGILLGLLSLGYRKWRKDRNWCLQQWKAKRYYIAYLGIALYTFLYLLSWANYESFWYDELYSVGYAMSGEAANSSFISYGLLRLAYQLMPYGQVYLLIVPIVEYCLAIYFLGVTGKRMRNGKTGIYAATCLAFAPYLYKQAAFEYRMYAVMLLCSIVAFYMFMLRFQGKKDTAWKIVGYGLALLLLMDSHEYGKVVAGLLVVVDIMLVMAKQLHKKNLISDIFPVVYGLFWLKMNAVGGLWNNYAWTKNPNFDDLYQTFVELCSGNVCLIWLFLLGIVLVVVSLVQKYYNKNLISMTMQYEFMLIYLVVGVFSASIVYSDYVNPANSLYVNRYFISVIAYIFLIAGVALDGAVRWISREKKEVETILCIWLCLLLAVHGRSVFVEEPSLDTEDYRGTAEKLSERSDIYNESTLVYIAEDKYAAAGWNYYFTEDGKFDSPNLANNDEPPKNWKSYDVVYVVSIHYPMDTKSRNKLNKNFNLEKYLKDGYDRKSISIYRKK